MFLIIAGLVYILSFILGVKSLIFLVRRFKMKKSFKMELIFCICLGLLYVVPILYLPFLNSVRNTIKFISNQSLIILAFIMIGLYGWTIIDVILSKVLKKKRIKRLIIEGGSIFIISLFFLVLGFMGGNIVKVTRYDLGSGRNEINIVLLSDTHFGANTPVKDTKQMVDTINELNADLVVFAGDIFDNDYYGLTNPEGHMETLNSIQSKYGVYAVWGNHDLQEEKILGFSTSKEHMMESGDEKMREFLIKSNITLLSDSMVEINEQLVLIGREDYIRSSKVGTGRKDISEYKIEEDKKYIVLDHEPLDYDKASEKGISLILSGHTHNGQFFPVSLLAKLAWPNNSYGYAKYNETDTVVTSGYGIWGPKYRLFTKKEIVQIDFSY